MIFKLLFVLVFRVVNGDHYWCGYNGTIPPDAYKLDNQLIFFGRIELTNLPGYILGGILKPNQNFLESTCMGYQKISILNKSAQILCSKNSSSVEWTDNSNFKSKGVVVENEIFPLYISKLNDSSGDKYCAQHWEDNEPIKNQSLQFLIDHDYPKNYENLQDFKRKSGSCCGHKNRNNKLIMEPSSENPEHLKIISEKVNNIENILLDIKESLHESNSRKLPRKNYNNSNRKTTSFETEKNPFYSKTTPCDTSLRRNYRSQDVEVFSSDLPLLKMEKIRKFNNKITTAPPEESDKPETIIQLRNLSKNATINLDVEKVPKQHEPIHGRFRRSKKQKVAKTEKSQVPPDMVIMEKIFEQNAKIHKQMSEEFSTTEHTIVANETTEKHANLTTPKSVKTKKPKAEIK